MSFYDLDEIYIKSIWDQQSGKCPLTGWQLILPQNCRDGWLEPNPANASLDRIDNAKGYIKNNVRFVSVIFNYARNQFNDNEMIEFCKAVSKYNEIKSSTMV